MKTTIPTKPTNVTWTDEQWRAIYAKNQDILIAAAAGSGKTAVLVERIIQKILDQMDPVDVDRLLVVTFTNASAAEMRHRIGEALEKAINDQPSSQHLRKQLALLNRASISTLHSFCLEVIRKYYYLIDVDPGFRIANDTEAQLLRDEVMDDLFEEQYSIENNESFFKLVDAYTGDRNDIELQDMVRELYDFSRANANPEAWLNNVIEMYDITENASIEKLPFTEPLLFSIQLQLDGAKSALEQALQLSKQPGGPAPRAENFIEDLAVVEGFSQASQESWKSLYEAMQQWKSFSRAKTCRGDEYDKTLIDHSQKLRDEAKKILQTIQSTYFSRKPESFLKDISEMKAYVQTLVELVKQFTERFSDIKKQRGLVDFADLEHYCLAILNGDKEGLRLSPSEAAEAYREHFKEVLVDEYQDTNMVQEAIIQLVTKDGEVEGNLFMVGDVKQSIYRFRLAEPNLFLTKYNRFHQEGENSGLRIDLARNFRSRMEVLEGTNFIFKQLMGEKVGEMVYDEKAALIKGAPYPENEQYPIEVLLIDEGTMNDEEDQNESPDEIQTFEKEELAKSQMEARLMAQKIKAMIEDRKLIFDPKTKTSRPVQYRDIVILLRSMPWAAQIMEEFKQFGIPIYANLSSGYFEATEVAIMMSLLKVIDNPYQDIPLASVLRSPIVGLDEEQLAQIRVTHNKGSFYEAVLVYAKKTKSDEEWQEKLQRFIHHLHEWRSLARSGSLSDLIWQLFRDSHFYEFVGGMPGGKQRQANLRALYDRARQYESTSFRGLFRFLRFIERMQDRGDDLGTARALGEQEDVVRLMTIHSSKGLEFPVVFIAGMGRKFNTLDLSKGHLLDKEFGFATKYVNSEKRITFPSLPQLSFKEKKKIELLAEEMRVLYVALTRAKEKLFIIGTVKDSAKKLVDWKTHLQTKEWLLPDYSRAKASSYLDWIGPAIIRHKDCHVFHEGERSPLVPNEIVEHHSCWKTEIIPASTFSQSEEEGKEEKTKYLEFVQKGEPVDVKSTWKPIIEQHLSWEYPYQDAATHRAKQSVSEMKRQREIFGEDSGEDLLGKWKKPLLKRPKFMQGKTLTPAEKGTAMHTVMQLLKLEGDITESVIAEQLQAMVDKELLTLEQKESIELPWICAFFYSDLGKRLVKADVIQREVPFSYALHAKQAYVDWKDDIEPVLVQGVIDCLFEDEDGFVLLDYKTDNISERFKGDFELAKPVLEERYKTQIDLYTQAVESILKKEVSERYLYFFDGGHILKL